MSGDAQRWVFEQKTKTANLRLVLLTIAFHADNDGYTFASNRKMRVRADVSRSWWREQVKELERLGLLSIETRHRDGGGQTSNGYQLNMEGGLVIQDPPGPLIQDPPGLVREDPPGLVAKRPHMNNSLITYEQQITPAVAEEDEMRNRKSSVIESLEENTKPRLEKDEIYDLAKRDYGGYLTAGGCAFIWRESRRSSEDDLGFQAEIPIGNQKMLKKAAKAVGEEFREAVWAVMQNWTGFTTLARESQAAFPIPGKPTIVFFTKYIESAVEFSTFETASETDGFLQLTATNKKGLTTDTIVVQDAPPLTSIEDLMEIDKDL